MSDSKKDLTRIEDLGEYLHELSEEEEVPAFEESELPTVPEEDSPFGNDPFASEDSSSFNEETPAFGASDESTFPAADAFSEQSETNDSSSFESTDFGTTDFTTSDEEAVSEDKGSFESTEESDFSSDFDSASEETTEVMETEDYSTPAPMSYSEDKFETSVYKEPENFEDIKKFAESSTPTGMGVEGNPSFSVLLKNIRFIEDINDILLLLKEFGLLTDPEDQVKKRMMRGQLLVPRISEYSAIYLAHKLRRFDIDIQVGLSDEIHPPKHQELSETGVVSKSTLLQNQTHHFQFSESKVELSQIIVAATPTLDGYQILKYLGVASEHKIIDGMIIEDESSEEIPRFYQELAQKLKAHALKANANAVMGINYQLTPLPSDYGLSGSKFRLSCTGNLVWVNKL